MTARDQWRARLVSSTGGGGDALRALVSELGLEGGDYARLGLRLAGQRAQVTLERRSRGSERVGRSEVIDGVLLSVKFEGPGEAQAQGDAGETPSIVLRREREGDVEDKERGLTREVQTGYPGFDHAVFIDNDSSEADVLRVLAREATRQAVLRLLEAGHPSVRISATGVSVRHRAKDGVVHAGPVLDALEDLLIVARAGGPKDPAPARRGEVLTAIGGGVCAAALAYGWLTWQAWPTTLAVAGVGAVAGAIVAFLSRPAIEAACSGDSSSGRRATLLLLLTFLAAGGLVFGALEHANGALDDSKGEVWRGVLTSSGERSTSRRRSLVEAIGVRWQDGSTSLIGGSDEMREGDRISERRHPGALGFPWFEERTITRR